MLGRWMSEISELNSERLSSGVRLMKGRFKLAAGGVKGLHTVICTRTQKDDAAVIGQGTKRFPAGRATSLTQKISDQILSLLTALSLTFHCYTKRSYKNTSTLHSMREIVNLGGEKCSCISDRVCRVPSQSLALRGVCFRTKTPRGSFTVSGGLTVGGHTVARITQRKVQNRLGQSVQGVPESGGCREGREGGAAPSRREG